MSSESAAKYNVLAKQFLTEQDISNAAINYEKALTLDPNDPEANFGGAITSGIMLMEDPDVQTIVTKWGAVLPTVNQVVQGTSPIKLPFGNMTSFYLNSGGSTVLSPLVAKTAAKSVASATDTQNVLTAFSALKAKLPQQKKGFKSVAKVLGLVPTTAPSIGEMQTLINNVIIPRIDKVVARLAKAETSTFSFTITKAMQGNPVNGTDATLNSGELYTLDAALNIFQVLFKIAGSYHFDIPTGYTYDTIGQDPIALINNSTTLTLNTGGAARMAGALDNAKAAAAKALLAYNKVNARTAGVGMFDLTNWTAQSKLDFTNGLTKVTAALAGPYALSTNGGAKIVNIDATKFFTNPLTRTQLPTFGYDVPRDASLSLKYNQAVAGEGTDTSQVWNGTAYVDQTRTYAISSDIVPKSDLPDYTLNGILPDNTPANNVAEFNGILPVLSGKLLSESVNNQNNQMNSGFTTDGTSIYYLKHGTDNFTVNPPTFGYLIKKIDAATGTITTDSTITSTVWAESISYFNGKFYLMQYNGSAYLIVNGVVGTTPAFSFFFANGGYLSAITSSGADIYYVLNVWNQLTYTSTSEIHKVTAGTDTKLFTVSDYVDKIAVSNGSIYIKANDTEKRQADGTLLATYTGAGAWNILVGGYFYNIGDGKIIKYAGTPAGGTAKAALAKYFGF